MALATSYNDLKPVRRVDEAEARAISNRIDEELKVSFAQVASGIPPDPSLMYCQRLAGGEGAASKEKGPEERRERYAAIIILCMPCARVVSRGGSGQGLSELEFAHGASLKSRHVSPLLE